MKTDELTGKYEVEESDENGLGMFGKGYNDDPIPPTEFISVMSGFTPAPDILVKEYGFVTALIWGRVWRFCQMADGVCRAAIKKIADALGMSERTIIRHLDELCQGGYLFDTTPELRNKPHIYADTGKIKIRVSVEGGMTQSQSRVTQSHSHYDRESVEESTKKELKRKEAATPRLSSSELEEIKTEANHTVDAILENERQAREREDAGTAWRGRELCPPQFLPYGDWWHAKTQQHMYGAKGKQKINAEWLKAFKEFYENEVSIKVLDETYDAEIVWKKIISKPSELIAKAKAIAALPPAKETKSETRNPFEALFDYLNITQEEGIA